MAFQIRTKLPIYKLRGVLRQLSGLDIQQDELPNSQCEAVLIEKNLRNLRNQAIFDCQLIVILKSNLNIFNFFYLSKMSCSKEVVYNFKYFNKQHCVKSNGKNLQKVK